MSVGEGNGNPIQYSCLENPVDNGAWWAAAYGIAQSQTRLKQLSMHACIGDGNGNPLQYSCLENPTDRGVGWVIVHGVTRSRTRLSIHVDWLLAPTLPLPQKIGEVPWIPVTSPGADLDKVRPGGKWYWLRLPERARVESGHVWTLGPLCPLLGTVSPESVLGSQLPGGPGDLEALLWPWCCAHGGLCCWEALEHVLEKQLRL